MVYKKKSPNKGQIIHIKLEYDEAKDSRKNILISEMSLLKISKNIKKTRDDIIKSKKL